MVWFIWILMAGLALTLAFRGRPYRAWAWAGTFGFLAWALRGADPGALFWALLVPFGALAAIFGWAPLRRTLVSGSLMRALGPILPRISETERVALDAGTVWWDGDLFSGKPDWSKLLNFHPKPLTAKEKAFLDGPVEELCSILDDWTINRAGDLPPEVWDFLKTNRFFGMIIPEEYGGLGFSAFAHSQVITRLTSRNLATSVTVMVPNSLGPAELLMHYGTDSQKRYYLPRLASGEEVPAFALTEPAAGSDAASGISTGEVCRGIYQGKEVLGIRLNWNKRYITLGPVATVLGLSFKLFDPDGLLGDQEELGITCALIPTDLPGVEIGARHDPLGVPFLNGPNFGRNVFVPLDFIIGGRERAGQGWRMLMDSLAAGRSISLPSQAAGATQLASRVSGAYATVREQFNLPIGRFEGIQEPLARIGGLTYMVNAARRLTAGAVDAGEKPAVLSAVVKAYLTEFMRDVVNDASDIQAGAAICEGPRNTLASAYRAIPIGITVEGANILTRSLIIYGQGAIRCHPYVQEEIAAVEARDLTRFDRAFFGHVGFVFTNAVRAFLLGLTNGRLTSTPISGTVGRHFGKLTRYSAAFTFLSDIAMGTLGARIKRMERLSGRMADALAYLYLASAVLKRFVDEGQRQEDRAFAEWSCRFAERRIEVALNGVLHNFPHRVLSPVVRWILFPWGRQAPYPSDRIGSRVARQMLDGREGRLHLSEDIHIPGPQDPGLGRLEAALAAVVRAQPIDRKIAGAVREHRLPRGNREETLKAALEAGIISEDEAAIVRAAQAARDDAIQVDAFDPEILVRADLLHALEKVPS